MAQLEIKSFTSPDEVRPFQGKGKAEVVSIGGASVLRGTFEPGWRWSENVRPLAGTDSCEVAHLAYVLSGRMRIVMDGGAGESTVGPGDVFSCPPGHDAEVVGDTPCVLVDFGAVSAYAAPAA